MLYLYCTVSFIVRGTGAFSVRIRESSHTNPCISVVARNKSGRPIFCSPLNSNTCPKNYFCLAGGSELDGRGYCCLKQSSKFIWFIGVSEVLSVFIKLLITAHVSPSLPFCHDFFS